MKRPKIPNRRLFTRRDFRTDVVFEDEYGDGLFYVESLDISMGGIFLASDIPVKIGTLLFLSVSLPPHKRPVRFTGEVVRIAKPGSQLVQGMGIRFVGLSETAQKRLEEFLSST